jgi:hypothetical protein
LAENDGVSQPSPNGRDDVPRGSVQRGAMLAGLPLGWAGRTALGIGKRIGGRSAELVAQEIQQRTADQVFRVLGELKDTAMRWTSRRGRPARSFGLSLRRVRRHPVNIDMPSR